MLEQYVSILPLILQPLGGSHYHQQHYHPYHPRHDAELGFLVCSHWNYVMSDFESSEIF